MTRSSVGGYGFHAWWQLRGKPRDPKSQRTQLANIWGSVALSNGLPPTTVDTYDHFGPTQTLVDIPAQLQFQHKLSRVVTAANLELGRTTSSEDSSPGATATQSIINMTKWQLDQLEHECTDKQGK
jgi:hypothetical protein